ncbi:MAG: threonine--tRNA ligase [Patescibacteria group bacterium]|jgi:threonyl-tRNA synthetase
MESDHKALGRELGLFSFDEKVPGVVYWWPKGLTLFNVILADLQKHLTADGYKEIKSASIISTETLKTSGHFDNYHEKLFFVGNEKELDKPKWCLKPMSCPGSLMIFNEEIHSYKDLPIKLAEFGTVFRYEQAGEVNGLLRLRNFTQDDAHIYCDDNHIEKEIAKLIDFVFETYHRYGFTDIRVELSTRPEKSIGSDEVWTKAEGGLEKALKSKKVEFKINKGDGAFYGPKIDFHVKDALGRSWQLGTIQLDFAMAERLDANYVDEKGEKKHPVMIHRAILGSVERFIAILLEQTGGALPTWLSPVQAIVLPIADRHNEYAEKIRKELAGQDVRVQIDVRTESVGKKIREAEMQKIPYMLVIGDKEIEADKVAVRKYGEGDKGQIGIHELVKEITK